MTAIAASTSARSLPSEETWDVVIVGAGPAGAMAARGLASRGVKVLLVDRAPFPRYKVCGSCLSPTAMQILRYIGLHSTLQRAVPTHALELVAYGKRAEIVLPGGAAVSRAAFDAALVADAVRAGAAFCDDTIAQWLCDTDNEVSIRLTRGTGFRVVRARAVVAADGLSGSFTRHLPGARVITRRNSWIGAGASTCFPEWLSPQTIRMCISADGYVGVVHVEDGTLALAAAVNPRILKSSGGLGVAVQRIMRMSGARFLPAVEDLRWRGTPPLSRRHTAPDSPRIFVVGDAAGYVEPFTGEGMAWALMAGNEVIAHVERRLLHPSARDGQRWIRARDRKLRMRKVRCAVVTAGLRSPTWTRIGLHVLGLRSTIATRVIAQLR
ncbi:MAG: NAD(P)/FAD-dependent oxidoreductase [Phycisphaerae bacterium]